MNEENNFFNNYDSQRTLKDKRWARIVIIFAGIGVFTGVSASLMFYFMYEAVLSATLALISGIIAGSVLYIHLQFIRDYWVIWTYQLKYWSWAGFILQTVFLILMSVFIALGIYYEEKPKVSSYYVAAVWAFMSWKWSFTLFYRSKRYKNMFSRYSSIGFESELSDNDG